MGKVNKHLKTITDNQWEQNTTDPLTLSVIHSGLSLRFQVAAYIQQVGGKSIS